MSSGALTLLRYPGGKQRQLLSFAHMLPSDPDSYRSYLEPFVGGASVFFHINPHKSVLSDVNPELIELYRGIRDHPDEIWDIYQSVPETKSAYYTIRKINPSIMDLPYRAARILYLNRTCFRGCGDTTPRVILMSDMAVRIGGGVSPINIFWKYQIV